MSVGLMFDDSMSQFRGISNELEHHCQAFPENTPGSESLRVLADALNAATTNFYDTFTDEADPAAVQDLVSTLGEIRQQFTPILAIHLRRDFEKRIANAIRCAQRLPLSPSGIGMTPGVNHPEMAMTPVGTFDHIGVRGEALYKVMPGASGVFLRCGTRLFDQQQVLVGTVTHYRPATGQFPTASFFVSRGSPTAGVPPPVQGAVVYVSNQPPGVYPANAIAVFRVIQSDPKYPKTLLCAPVNGIVPTFGASLFTAAQAFVGTARGKHNHQRLGPCFMAYRQQQHGAAPVPVALGDQLFASASETGPAPAGVATPAHHQAPMPPPPSYPPQPSALPNALPFAPLAPQQPAPAGPPVAQGAAPPPPPATKQPPPQNASASGPPPPGPSC